MNLLIFVRKMAQYNVWMNGRVFSAAALLPPEELSKDRSAFFSSILGTLNHLVVADTIWLKRFAQHTSMPASLVAVSELLAPERLDQVLFDELGALRDRREMLDKAIAAWSKELTEADLDSSLQYANMKGVVSTRRLGDLAMHFFNHQTHHRGQATALLTQAGQDVGVTDFLAILPSDA